MSLCVAFIMHLHQQPMNMCSICITTLLDSMNINMHFFTKQLDLDDIVDAFARKI